VLKRTIGLVTALFIVGAPMAHAQRVPGAGEAHDNGRLSQTEFKVLTDARVGMVKAALQLTSEQQQFWPAVEDVIRARSETRYRRLSVSCSFIASAPMPWRNGPPGSRSPPMHGSRSTRASPSARRCGCGLSRCALEGMRATAESRCMDMSDEDVSEF
jgi:hypothetical protein